ncbi:hypothetical protein K505DRAFT_332263 [Melanomma pulvis-pyrius CBS 109.77]|uniref:Uncharacterized protein n=1 Tax=Melanomma pulvis-pyrius CBS 109.77 TaxID=1314802 RepID=A0A6A6XU69_9PLEO|nr:hypothetical protein K505DRAFT_332263 [Melanomma pulvis-pyrius CBS 109.77]
MKPSFATTLALLTTGITALPATLTPRQTIFPKISISVINDLTGASAVATVVADGTVFPILTLFGGSRIDIDGIVTASSAQLIAFVDNVFCSFNKDDLIIPINGKNFVFADLDGNKEVAAPINLNAFTFQCQV